MSRKLLMAIDLGGGGLRCLLLDPDTLESVICTRSWTPGPDPKTPLGALLDPEVLWSVLADCAQDALRRAEAAPHDIAGIAATSFRHGSALVGSDGRTIALMTNRDARGTGSAIALARDRGEEIHAITGHWPNPIQPAARLLWLLREDANCFDSLGCHLSLNDWIGFRLTGECATDPSQATESLLFELDRPQWAWDLIDSLELSRSVFPNVQVAGSRLGELTPAAALALGLVPGTPVAVGAADSQCGLLGMGVLGDGETGVVLGSTAPMLQVGSSPLRDPIGRLWGVHHAVPGRWALESNGGGLGDALDWISGLLHPTAAHPILHLFDEAAHSPIGSAGLLSTLGAEVMDARELGLPIGNLTLNYMTSAGEAGRRSHLGRAVLEGMVFGLRANLEQLEAVTGEFSERIRVCGGVSRSAFFTQLLADATGRTVETSSIPEATLLGAAICAGVGAGLFDDLASGVRSLVRGGRSQSPDAGARSHYDTEVYPVWNEIRCARAASDSRAAGVAVGHLLGGSEERASQASSFRPKILVTADLDEVGLGLLEKVGEVESRSFRTAMQLLAGRQLVQALEGVHVFVTEIDVVDASVLVEAKDLRLIICCRGDAVNVDLEACTALGIPVIHTPGRNADAVADLAVANMLMLARKLPEANAFLREPGGEAGDMGRMGRAFGKFQGGELWQKTVGLVGLGAVGRKVAERVRSFGARCVVFDPFLEPDTIRLAGAEPVCLEELLAASDFVSLHAPVTDDSVAMIGSEQLAKMKPGAFLINTARAALLDEGALLHALESGSVRGAALDVFAEEPPASDHPLLALPQVVATPHIGGNTREVAAHQGRMVVAALERLLAGDRPDSLLNAELLDGYDLRTPRPAPDESIRSRIIRKSAEPAVSDLERDRNKRRFREQERANSGVGGHVDREAPEALSMGGKQMEEIQAKMRTLIERFLEGCGRSAELRQFAQDGNQVTMAFRLKDLGIQFFLEFSGGDLTAASGSPENDSDLVELRLTADLFDGMLTGRRNAMQAAMDGELSFRGDTAKAMTLQQINREMSRAWKDALAALGPPGDLASLSASGTSDAVDDDRPATGGQEDERHELCRIIDELYATQLITSTGGNVSVRRRGHDGEAWITPSQLFKGDLSAEALVRIGMNGKALDEGARSASSEVLMHTAVLAAKPEAEAVIHCHAPYSIILANTELPFLPISTESAFFQNIGRIPFVMPGTQELADAVVEAMGDGWAVLMQNHGLLVAGRTLRRAADMSEIIERTCQVILGCYAVGREPPVLPQEIVEQLASYGDLMA